MSRHSFFKNTFIFKMTPVWANRPRFSRALKQALNQFRVYLCPAWTCLSGDTPCTVSHPDKDSCCNWLGSFAVGTENHRRFVFLKRRAGRYILGWRGAEPLQQGDLGEDGMEKARGVSCLLPQRWDAEV